MMMRGVKGKMLFRRIKREWERNVVGKISFVCNCVCVCVDRGAFTTEIVLARCKQTQT